MAFINSILLGIVEGVTEFLPISSTGHLILVGQYLDLGQGDSFEFAFNVIIQLPAILAVLVYFWRDLWPFGAAVDTPAHLGLWVRIVIAFLPAAVLGFLFADFIEEKLSAPLPVALALMLGGVVLILCERRTAKDTLDSVYTVPCRTAFLIGCFQCLAMFPGVSRSAATIIGGMLLGARRPVAAEFSFFLAIPTMLGAAALTILKMLLKGEAGWNGTEWGLLATGSVVSFLVAYGVIKLFMGYVKKYSFAPFGYYRIVLGAIVIAWLILGR